MNPIFQDLRRRDVALLAMAALLVLGTGLGLRDPWPSDEPRFMLMARNMIDTGNWMFPQRGGELYSDKPPLFMWLQAGAYLLVRNWKVAFILPTLLAGLGVVACVYDLGRRLWSHQVALYAAWTLLLTSQFSWQVREAHLDTLVMFWITLANYGLLRHMLHKPDWRMWALGWFAAGLGVITKGVGVLALLMLLPAAFAAWRGWPRIALPLRDVRVWSGPLAFLAAIAIWVVPMVVTVMQSGDPLLQGYMRDILVHQTADRYVSSWVHPEPPWFFLGVIGTRWIPLLLLLPWAVPAWRRRLLRRDPRYLLPLAWCVLVVLFFSFPSGKREVYILPALPMICLALAPLLPGLLRMRGPRRMVLGFTVFIVVAMTAAAIAMAIPDSNVQQRLWEKHGFDHYTPLVTLLAACAAWGVGCLLWFGRHRAVAALVATLVGGWTLYGLVAYPVLNDTSSGRALMRDVGARLGPDAQLGMVAWREQMMLWVDRPAVSFGMDRNWDDQRRMALAWQAQVPGKRWLLFEEGALAECIDRDRAQRVGINNSRVWWLVPAAAVTPACGPASG